MGKEASDNHKGLLGWSIGFAGFILSILQPIAGLVLGIVGLVMNSSGRNKREKTEWSNAGKVLSIAAIIISVVIIVLSFIFILKYGLNYFTQLQNLQG